MLNSRLYVIKRKVLSYVLEDSKEKFIQKTVMEAKKPRGKSGKDKLWHEVDYKTQVQGRI